MIKRLSLLLPLAALGGTVQPSTAQKAASPRPIVATQRVADKMLRTTPFEYMLAPSKPSVAFDNIKVLNLARTYSAGQPGVAYALSAIESPADTTIRFDFSHNDGARIWINKQVAYEQQADGPAVVTYKERDIMLAHTFEARLKKGVNELLIKSETKGKEWVLYLKPHQHVKGLKLNVAKVPLVSPELAAFSNWLVIGPFPNPEVKGQRTGLSQVYEPEREFQTARLYSYGGAPLAWTVPKLELTTVSFGSTMAWGDNNYSWNYHAGGVAWAMGHLGEYTGQEKYDQYSRKYCEFFIDKKPYLEFQKYNLGGLAHVDNKIAESYMLDFTTAPTMPYTYWLASAKNLPRRAEYQKFHQDIKDYAVNKQFRLPEGNFARATPHRYTTWADDMYMGIPFLVHSARIAQDPKEKDKLLNDAASQLLAFYKQVWDPEFNLYRQTQYSDRKVKIPFWSRANGWGLWATLEVLQYLPKTHPHYAALMTNFKSHIDSLLKYQDEKTGFWHNLVDKPDSYPETSGTAIFTMAMARGITNGWLPRKTYQPYVLKGWQAIESVIEADGTLHGTCIGTNMSENIQDYYTRPVADDDTHGVLPVLFAGIAVDKMLLVK